MAASLIWDQGDEVRFLGARLYKRNPATRLEPMWYMIEHSEGLSRSLEAVARKLVKLDWPTDLVVVLQDGQTRPLERWERDELHAHVGELLHA